MAALKRLLALSLPVLLFGALAPVAAAQESLVVTISDSEGDHLWTGDPAKVSGRATLADGQVAAGRVLIVESRPYPYRDAFTEQARVLTGTDGRFTYQERPIRNVQIRIRGDAGQSSQIVTLRVFHFALSGKLKSRSGDRQQATETSSVPPGYRIAKVYLYFCKPRAKRCTFSELGKARINGQQMTATATFKPPRKYATRKYTVIFRYVPKAGWGDSNAAERRKPKQTLTAEAQGG